MELSSWMSKIIALLVAVGGLFFASRDREEMDAVYIYESLSKVVRYTNQLQFGDEFANFTMHRRLTVPTNLRHKYYSLHDPVFLFDLLLDAAGLHDGVNARVLDLGSGWGGFLFLAVDRVGLESIGMSGGVTISEEQMRVSTFEADKRGYGAKLQFHKLSFDSPNFAATLGETYDVIVAVESLLHSSDINVAIANAAATLDHGGKFIIAGDFLAKEAMYSSSSNNFFLKCWEDGWQTNKAMTGEQYGVAMANNGLSEIKIVDLGKDYGFPIGSKWQVGLIAGSCCRLQESGILPMFLHAFCGGFALQHLYHDGTMSYTMNIYEKA